MPRDTSSSSDEDEADDPTTKSPVKRKESHQKATRYQCPDDFVHFVHKPCSSTLTESLKNSKNELWLIKAPASFNAKCFSGIKVPLSGLQNLRVPAAEGGATTGSGPQIFSTLASTHGTADLCLLTSDKKSSDGMVFGPAFSGLLNVCESCGESSADLASHIIPAAPAPSIPPGLKQRFHHFGSNPRSLTRVAESETDGAALGASSATPCPPVGKRLVEETWQEEEKEGRKKKKRKKEKRLKSEREEETSEVFRVKVEPLEEIKDEVMTDLSLQEGDILGNKRKKKKKKKSSKGGGGGPSLRVKVEGKE